MFADVPSNVEFLSVQNTFDTIQSSLRLVDYRNRCFVCSGFKWVTLVY